MSRTFPFSSLKVTCLGQTRRVDHLLEVVFSFCYATKKHRGRDSKLATHKFWNLESAVNIHMEVTGKLSMHPLGWKGVVPGSELVELPT